MPAKRKQDTAGAEPAWVSGFGTNGLDRDEIDFLADLVRKQRAGLFVEFATRLAAEFYVQGSFTVCLLSLTMPKPARTRKGQRVVAEGKTLIGVAKRNCHDDDWDVARGKRIALARAARGEAVQQ